MQRFLLLLLLPLLALTSVSPLAKAEVSPWQEIPEGRARLLASGNQSDSGGEGGPIALGLEVDLNEGWKIYWQYAGTVGLPSRFTFEGGQGEVFYPWPKRSVLQGFPSYGYDGRVLFPGYGSGGGTVQLDVSICSETACIPFRTRFDMPGPATAPDPLVLARLQAAMDQVPTPKTLNAAVTFDAENGQISLPIAGRDFLLDPGVDAARAGFFLGAATPGEGQISAEFTLNDTANIGDILADAALFWDDGTGLFVNQSAASGDYVLMSTLLGRAPPEERLAQAGQDIGAGASSPAGWSGFFQAAALLFVGGLLLNVMPCVFPILFLKLKTALSGQADLRASFGWTAVGMVGTFVVLGVVLALIQGGTGAQLTLGAWMQFPLTTLILGALIVLFIANALGWFEFRVPGRLANARGDGILGDVIAGAVAALLGGACAGALLAFALAFAFSAGGITMVALLALMGLGLALPYILVALIPGAARYMPRPGPWLGWVKPVMAAGLGLTFAYLVFIATRQIAVPAVALVIILGFAGLALFRARRTALAFVALTVMALALPWWALPPDVDERARDYRAEISTQITAGQSVLVDVTAYWCATCQTNKLLVLDTPEVQAMLAAAGAEVFTINADIYHPNVNAFLSEVGRSSLPLNILYSPQTPEGLILPSVLTRAAVRQALEETKG